MNKKNKNFISFAHYLADEAREIINEGYKKKKKINEKKVKDKTDVFTQSDLKLERKIKSLIKLNYPSHNIVGEETGKINKKSLYTWIIDPIDGTKAFISGIPVFSFLLSLNYKNKYLLGLADFPVLNERYWNDEKDAFLNDCKISTNHKKKISSCIMACTDPNMFKNFEEINNKILKKFKVIRWGTDALGYMKCAEGIIDVVIERDIKIWDIAAVSPIIEAAGGCISTWDGKPIGTNDTVCVSSNKQLQKQLVKKLQNFI